MKTNIDYLLMIKKYCEEIFGLHERFDYSFDNYENDIAYRNSVNMCIMQIGETSARLSEEFKAEFSGINWRKIKDFRNILAHRYDIIDNDIAFSISTNGIKELYLYVNSILEMLEKS